MNKKFGKIKETFDGICEPFTRREFISKINSSYDNDVKAIETPSGIVIFILGNYWATIKEEELSNESLIIYLINCTLKWKDKER